MEADVDREFQGPGYPDMTRILDSRREGMGSGWAGPLALHTPALMESCRPRRLEWGPYGPGLKMVPLIFFFFHLG